MGDDAALRRLTPRRWRILSFLALHGSATTMDAAVVAGISRLAAHRDLAWLHGAGLVSRWRSDEDRTHTWWYEVTAQGAELLSRDLAASGRLVPLQLGQRQWSAAHHLLFLPLIEVSRQNPGRCELFQWLTTMDTSAWLRQHNLAHLRADGYGIWLEDGHCLRFLVHVDPGPVGEVAEHEQRTYGLDAVLAGYQRTDPVVPVGACWSSPTASSAKNSCSAAWSTGRFGHRLPRPPRTCSTDTGPTGRYGGYRTRTRPAD